MKKLSNLLLLGVIVLSSCRCKKDSPITPVEPDTTTAPKIAGASILNITHNSTAISYTVSNGGIASTFIVFSSSKENSGVYKFDTVYNTVSGQFTFSGLTSSSRYSFQISVINAKGTAFRVFDVTTLATPATLATVTTTVISGITSSSAISGGTVTSDGSGTITARGVCIGTSPNPTVSEVYTSDGTGTGTFTSNLIGLVPGTTYHIRSYATNSAGTGYGSDVTFTTVSGFTIGQIYGGGKIFHVYNGGTEAYVVDTVKLADKYAWGARNILLGNTSTAFGTGPTNTTNIVNGFTGGPSAAKLCDTSTRGGYSDWFLGSKDEWLLLVQNKALVGITLESGYWTSSEFDDTLAWVQSWNGSQGKTDKMDGNFPLFGAPAVLAFRKVHL